MFQFGCNRRFFRRRLRPQGGSCDRQPIPEYPPQVELAFRADFFSVGDPIDVGRLVSVANFVDPKTRTVKVIYELTNGNRQLAVEQAASLRLFRQSRKEGPAILESAVVDDAGRPVVYVQTGGESFERRAVMLGERQGGMVLVTEGLSPGERVVTKGAYLIRLASMSTQAPAHGHAH